MIPWNGFDSDKHSSSINWPHRFTWLVTVLRALGPFTTGCEKLQTPVSTRNKCRHKGVTMEASDNKSRGCCWRNSLATVINPKVNFCCISPEIREYMCGANCIGLPCNHFCRSTFDLSLRYNCPVINWQVHYKFISRYDIALFMIAFKRGNIIGSIRIKTF